MAVYIMSDIHGMHDKFITMLREINFNKDDELYILGDIFDRGDKPLEILEYIVRNKNIHLLLGNHEEMFLEAYENGFHDLQLWFMNGGATTYYSLIEKGEVYINETYKYIKKLHTFHKLNYGYFSYLLCHAGIEIPPKVHGEYAPDIVDILERNSRTDFLWSRKHIESYYFLESINIICGHTPTINIQHLDEKSGLLVKDEFKVIQKGSFIYIDCGACFEEGKLACIELLERGYKSYYV